MSATALMTSLNLMSWVGSRCEIHSTFIGAVECGERNVTINKVEKIAKSLRIDIADLFIDNTQSTTRRKA